MAWTILLTAFAVFCLVAISCPLTVRSYLRNARKPLHAQINAQQGTVRVERKSSNSVDATSADDPTPIQMFTGDHLRTGGLDEGLLVLQKGGQDNRETLVSIVIYYNSEITLKSANSPRFGLSHHFHYAKFQIKGGRARIEIQPADDGRPVQVEVQSDHASIILAEGSYFIEATHQQTTVTVRDGQAAVHANDQHLTLGSEERAIVLLEGTLEGPVPAERNLILNGNFSAGIDAGWIVDPANDTPAQVNSAADSEGQPVAQFQHDQPQPSEIRLIQTLNRNVRDLDSLVLHLKVRIDSQSLSVCGSQGTECPVMVRIDYIDVAGGARQWVHGFFTFEDPAQTGILPYYCLVCPPPSGGNHSRVTQGAWFLYDSPNLMKIEPPELRPAIIQSVHVYASGHSYESMVTDVELLAQE
jgi:hypothetical protein